MRRIIVILLAIATLLSTLVSCGKDNSDTPDSSETTDINVYTDGTDADEEDVPEIPQITIDRAINIYRREGARLEEWEPERDVSGYLVMNDALFERNVTLADKYNVTFNHTTSLKENAITEFENIVNSGEDSIDFISFDAETLYSFARRGFLKDVNDLTYCDFDKDYWYGSNLNDLAEKDGTSYLAFGYTNLNFQWCSYVVYYNTALFEQHYKTDDPYQLVFDKKWTLEKMLEYAKGVYADGGDDTTFDDDTFGIIQPGGGWYSTFFGSGLQVVSKDANGDFVCNLNNETLLGRLQNILDYTFDPTITLYFTGPELVNQNFANGKGLFYTESFNAAKYFQENMESYGILPSPLLNEGDEYYTHTHYTWSSATGVPVTLSDDKLEQISIFLEDANYYSKKIQLPVMIETVLKGRVAQDWESVEIIDIVTSNIHIDAAFVHTPEQLSFDVAYRELIAKANRRIPVTELVSVMTTVKEAYDNYLSENVNK